MSEFSRLPIKDATDLLLSLRVARDGVNGEWRLTNPSKRVARVLHRHGVEVRIEEDGTIWSVSEWHPGHRPVPERLTR